MSDNYIVEKAVDYLSFTCSRFGIFEPDIFKEGIKDEIQGGNSYGYNRKQILNNGVIVMWHTDLERMGVHYVYSGSVLRKQKQAISEILDSALLATDNKLSRIDIAVTSERRDGKPHELTPQTIANLAFTGQVETRLEHGVQIGKNLIIETAYFGSLKSRKRLFRAYDKGLEQGHVSNHLIRYELESRQYAGNLGLSLSQGLDMGSIINKYIRVIDPVWDEIMGSETAKIPHIESYELDDLLKKWDWLLTSCAPALGKAIAQTEPEKLEIIMRQFQARVYSNYRVTKGIVDN